MLSNGSYSSDGVGLDGDTAEDRARDFFEAKLNFSINTA